MYRVVSYWSSVQFWMIALATRSNWVYLSRCFVDQGIATYLRRAQVWKMRRNHSYSFERKRHDKHGGVAGHSSSFWRIQAR